MLGSAVYFTSRIFIQNAFDNLTNLAICTYLTSQTYLFYRTIRALRQIGEQPTLKSRISKAYEQLDGLMFYPSNNPLHRRKLIRKLLENVDPEGKILVSLGGNVGRIENKLAELGADVINIDTSVSGLEKCKKINPEIECVVADAESLPLKNNSADILFSSEAIGHFSPTEVFGEAHRVLKEDGVAQISTYKNTSYNRCVVRSGLGLYKLYPSGHLSSIAIDAGFNQANEKEYWSLSAFFEPRKMTMLTAKK